MIGCGRAVSSVSISIRLLSGANLTSTSAPFSCQPLTSRWRGVCLISSKRANSAIAGVPRTAPGNAASISGAGRLPSSASILIRLPAMSNSASIWVPSGR